MTYEELYKQAMEAFKNPETRLSKNLRMHRERYMLKNKHLIKQDKQIKKQNDMRKGGMVISTVNNLKK